MIICIATLSAPLYPKPPRRTGIEPKTKSTISPWDVALWYSGPQTQHCRFQLSDVAGSVSFFIAVLDSPGIGITRQLAVWPSQYNFISPRLVSEHCLHAYRWVFCVGYLWTWTSPRRKWHWRTHSVGGLLVLLPIVLTGPENNVKPSGTRLDFIPKNSVIRGIPLCDLIQGHEQV